MVSLRRFFGASIASRVRRNIVANFAGKGWVALMSIAFVPLYIKYLGIEAYALVGVYVSLQALFALLGTGITSTVNRSIAKLMADNRWTNRIQDAVHTLRILHMMIGAGVGAVVIGLSYPLAHYWLNSQTLPHEDIRNGIVMMGFAMAAQWPVTFHISALTGLQEHARLNLATSVFATLRAFGAVFVLAFLSPTILAFFGWQAIINFAQGVMLSRLLKKSLPKATRSAAFRRSILRLSWRYLLGVSTIALLGTILTQADKIVLSKIIPLDSFGYYVLAAAVASILGHIVMPIQTAMFPRFTELVTQNRISALSDAYHRGSQLVSVSIMPIAVILVLFSREILTIWGLDDKTVEMAYVLVILLTTARVFNSLMRLPYALQLAYEWTRLGLYSNLLAVIAVFPLTLFLVLRYGAIGGAASLVILNTAYVMIQMVFMHKRLLPGELSRWYLMDTGLPLLATCSVAVPVKLMLINAMAESHEMAVMLLGTVLISAMAAAAAAPGIRRLIMRRHITIPAE